MRYATSSSATATDGSGRLCDQGVAMKDAAPHYPFKDASVDLTPVSPTGGQPPIDPKSDLPENQTCSARSVRAGWVSAWAQLGNGQVSTICATRICRRQLASVRQAEDPAVGDRSTQAHWLVD